MEIVPKRLPQLSKQLRDHNSQKHRKNSNSRFQRKYKIKDFSRFKDSRHAQMSIYAVFHEETDVQVKKQQLQHLEAKKRTRKNCHKSLYKLFSLVFVVLCYETRWKSLPGVSRSFLNSSRNKITATNKRKLRFY